MEKFFEDVKSLEELNQKRATLLSEINKQFREKRDALQTTDSGVKLLKFINLNAIEIPTQPTFAAMTIERGNVPSNTIKMEKNVVQI